MTGIGTSWFKKDSENKIARLTTNLPSGALKIAVSFKTTVPNHPSLGYFFLVKQQVTEVCRTNEFT